MNNRIASGFDFLAPVYDGLARRVIGKAMIASQLHFIPRFAQCNRLLILGGGSGWLLNHVCAANPDLEIDYIDVSFRMLRMAERRVNKNQRITFIQGTEDSIQDRHYDAVLTNFYLDMFDENGLKEVLQKIKKSVAGHVLWLATDFVNERIADSIRLWLMYRFFRIITCIKARHLPDWQEQMQHAGFELSDQKKFNNGFIVSNVYTLLK